MKPSPCLSPVRVYNKTLGAYMYVPCGHCDACVVNKGFSLSERLAEAVACYTHKYFVTLTFSDDYLPVAKYDDNSELYLHPYDSDYNGVTYSVSKLDVELSLNDSDFRRSYEKYNGVPVLSRRLAINFKKRLRKIFSKHYGKEYLFVYIVGEYGATTYRPHYHCILCTNAPIIASLFESCVYKAWSYFDKVKQKYICQYGRIDIQRIISSGVHNYVAQYLTCSTYLPVVYQKCSQFRPFYQSSPLIDAEFSRYSDTSLQSVFDRCGFKFGATSHVDNRFDYVYPSKGIIDRYFPKCESFSCLSHIDRVCLYELFRHLPFVSAKEFAILAYSSFFGSCRSIDLCKSLFIDGDKDASLNRLVKMFYISRRVCRNADLLAVSVDTYVYRIELFWSRYELSKLKDFYELQVSLLTDTYNPVSVNQLFCLYYDTDDNLKHLLYYYRSFNNPTPNDDLKHLSVHNDYVYLSRKILLDSTKTKKRNGYFDSKGFSRPSFLSKFKIKKSCLKFSRI